MQNTYFRNMQFRDGMGLSTEVLDALRINNKKAVKKSYYDFIEEKKKENK